MINRNGVHLPDTTYGGNPIDWNCSSDSDDILQRLTAENAKLERVMCYTGSCPYENSSSGYGAGECALKDGEPIPYDAACMLAERKLEEWELRHPLRVLAKELRYRLSRLWLEFRWRFFPKDLIPF